MAVSQPQPAAGQGRVQPPYHGITSVARTLSAFGEVTSQSSTPTASGMVRVLAEVRSAAGDVIISRVAGRDRYETALEASRRAFSGGAPAVVLATGMNWPDALGGSALAGASRAPLLLTYRDRLPAAVGAEIRRLNARKVYILGGTAAVGPGVERALVGMLGRAAVVRLGGSDRYGTARLVADETVRVLGGGYSGDALVATGGNFPDATAGAALAAALRRPILLVKPSDGSVYVPMATRRVLILGGPRAVSSATERSLIRRLGSGGVARAGGANRYETAVLIARAGVGAGMSWDGVGIATGADFPDALAGGAMLGARRSVMLLTGPRVLSTETATELAAHRAEIRSVHIFGGTKAVSQAVEDSVRRVPLGP
jgi:hypothetical protein